MPAAARSKLCSSVSAWSGVFASIAMSSAQSASVIVFAGYLLLLFFVSSKPFSLISSIDRMIYKNTDVMIHSFNSFDILTGVLKGDKLAQYMFIICLDQVLQTSINLKNKKMVLHFKKKGQKQTISSRNYYGYRVHR